MAAAATPSADQTADLIENLKLDSQSKDHDAAEDAKPALGQYNSSNGAEAANKSVPPREPTLTPLLQEMSQMMDHANTTNLPRRYTTSWFCGYGNVDKYFNQVGGEMPSGVYGGDLYHQGYGYAPYDTNPTPDSPVPTMGSDGQLYGTQHYQYPTQYYQPPTPNASYGPHQDPTRASVSTAAAANQDSLSANLVKATLNDTAKGNVNGNNGSSTLNQSHQNRPSMSNSAYLKGGVPGGLSASGYQDFRYGYDTMQSPVSWYDGTLLSTGEKRPSTTASAFPYNVSNSSARNQNQQPLPHLMGLHTQRPLPGMMGSTSLGFSSKLYPSSNRQYGNTYRSVSGYRPNWYDSRVNGRWRLFTDTKYKPRGRGNGSYGYGYGNENLDGFRELNRGPRAGCLKNTKADGPNITIAVKGQSLSSTANEEVSAILPGKEQYNREDFPENYTNAKFYVIKSYSEDDIHKSIKYGVWASTPNGNKKLDGAYNEARAMAGECPVFLLFSVNTSGQFVGLAEMVGQVDFDKTMDYWQQDKWFGCFLVKWHIVKDVPNSILKHITLENNDNQPVTNSRDTQEVKLEQGLQVLKIFKEHVSRTSILDDFGFYEDRQKTMQEKRVKQHQYQKQVMDGHYSEATSFKKDEDLAIAQKPSEPVSISDADAHHQIIAGDQIPSEESGTSVVSAGASPATEKAPSANGVADVY